MEGPRTRNRLPLLASAILAAVGVAAIGYSSAAGPRSDADPEVGRVATQNQSGVAAPDQGGGTAGGHDALTCPDGLPDDMIARLRALREPVDEPHGPYALTSPAAAPDASTVPVEPRPAPDETTRERILRALRVGPDDTPLPPDRVELRVPGCDQ